MTTYVLKETNNGIELRGGAKQLWQCRSPEVVLSGPAETGKTIGALHKMDALMWKYPGCQAAMVRKVYADIKGSVVVSYEKKVLSVPPTNDGSPVLKHGGEAVQFYQYPNGSRLWVGGMDNPGKVLSAERDFVYVNQAEELTLEDWETLTTRVTGRAGNSPYPQILADCNPGPANHWILQRAKDGDLTLFHSRHEDNPFLYDIKRSEWTEQGKFTLSRLDALTGVRKSRLRHGQWVSAEGQVYEEYNHALHLIDPFDVPADWRHIRAIDFGYTNPFTCLWIAIDPDGRMYIYRQIYKTGRLVSEHTKRIIELSDGQPFEATICDHDSEHRASLNNAGVDNIRAKKDVLAGIEKVKARLAVAGDGQPRLFIMRNCLVEADRGLMSDRKPYRIEDEFESYTWHKTKEQPIKEYDHALDALRYAVMYVDGGGVWVR